MANSKPDPLPSKVFEFAAIFAEFRYRAEYFWCEDGEDGEEYRDLQYIERDKEILIALATEISRIPALHQRCRRFPDS
jgi:hypothetical protein